jgi:integrase
MKKQKPIRSKWPRVIRVKSHGAERFMVDSRRTGFSRSGRTFYESESEAIAVAEQLERILHNEGARAFVDLSAQERSAASEAIAILAEYDADLVDAARHYVAHLKRERQRVVGPTLKKALAAYLKAKQGETERGELSRLTYLDLVSKGNTIRDYFGEKRLTEIDRAMVEDFVAGLHLKPRGKFNVLLKLSQLLNWSMRQGWIAANAASEVKVKVPQSDVEILSVPEVKALLRRAEESEQAQKIVPYLVVSLFAGLRPGEGQQLRWERIDLANKQIEVRAETSKVKETRFIEINPTLAQWLKPFRQKSGPIVASSFSRDLAATRTNGNWPKDVLRHSFASYWLPCNPNRAALAETMGNSISVIKKSYRKAIAKRVAAEFWKIRPKGRAPKPVTEGKVIDFPSGQSPELAAASS